MSGCIFKEVIDVVVDVFQLSCGNICGNLSNCSYHGWVDGTGTENKGSNELLAVYDLWLC